MNDIDRILLNKIQSGFPISLRPYLDLGRSLGISEEEVIQRVKALKEKGIIRRIGGIINSRKLGFASTLCAASVPEDKIEIFVEKVNSYRGVTHNYLRDNDYNIWFTLIAPDSATVEKCIMEISDKTGISGILNMPAERMFKIKVDFEI
ncbi:MAG: AsnC family transcriptional regulator [Deltaproteobacteria bacterium]|nr:AsnC family transcriptional regulator [Deltaproteobacteria bacterium]